MQEITCQPKWLLQLGQQVPDCTFWHSAAAKLWVNYMNVKGIQAEGTRGMVPLVKVPALKSDEQGSVPRSHMAEGRKEIKIEKTMKMSTIILYICIKEFNSYVHQIL